MTDNPTACRAKWFFTTRHGGVSSPPYDSFNVGDHVGDDPASVASNRRALLAGCDPGVRLVTMDQTHSSVVAVIDDTVDGSAVAADGVVTTTPGLALMVVVADCVPLLLIDVDHTVCAAVHSGRVGTEGGIATNAVEAMLHLGARAASIRAVLGPCIGGCCYEVDLDTFDRFTAAYPHAAATTSWGSASLDLASAVASQLRAASVTHIEVPTACTACSAEYFSYRRDRTTGRHAGVVYLTNP